MPPATNSDSEDDLDYVPPAEDYESDDHQEPRSLEGSVPVVPLKHPAEEKKQRDALWASFQAFVTTPPPNGTGDGTGNGVPSTEVKRVKIERTYLFAGKHVTEVVEVPEDSEDAKKWPRWSPRPSTSGAATPSSEKKENEGEVEVEGKDKGESPTPVVSSPAPSTSMSGAKRPGPRKPRTTLPSVPKASQPKKITTLDKSAMDWREHVSTQSGDVKDELDANRRGGGYLEKVDFLKRVDSRREDVLEASKASKRRKT